MINKWIIGIANLVMISISIIVFWFWDQGDPMGYSILFMYILNPIVMVGGTIIIGTYKEKTLLDAAFPLFFAIGYMLIDYFTFSLANMIANNSFNAPNFELLLGADLVCYVGFIIGYLIKVLKNYLYNKKSK